MFSRAGSMQLAQHHVWDMEWDLYKDDGSMLVAWSNALYTTDGIQGTNVAGDIDSAGYVEGKGERYWNGFIVIEALVEQSPSHGNKALLKISSVY